MRFPAPMALTALALAVAGTAACDVFNPDARPSLAVTVETRDAVVGEPVLVVVRLADEGGLRDVVVDWGDGSAETFDLSGTTATLDLEHVYDSDARFEIQATVRDSAGQSASATAAVTVSPAPEPAVSDP